MLLDAWLAESSARLQPVGRPLVTLSYAQSLDGSITLKQGVPTALSGMEAMRMTHRMRAAHDAILAGVGTIESDNPQLNVRYAEGDAPQPVILDSHLRTPVSARLFSHPKHPIIACLESSAALDKARELAAAGAIILPVAGDENGTISLPELLMLLHQHNISSLMVEGGARVIQSFLAHNLVDRVVITIAPIFLGGLKAVDGPLNSEIKLEKTGSERYGEDIVVWGELPGNTYMDAGVRSLQTSV